MKPKKCQCCGKEFTEVPKDAKLMITIPPDSLDGAYWNCECRTTLFIPFEELKKEFTRQHLCDHHNVEHMTCTDCNKSMLDEFCLGTDQIVSEMKGK